MHASLKTSLPSFQLSPRLKGYPHRQAPMALEDIGAMGWNILASDLPLPLAVLKQSALVHNVEWMQRFVQERGIDLAPHGKTTMSAQLFARQLDAGAWGLTFATVTQARIGVACGARRVLIANQVLTPEDLAGIQALRAQTQDLRLVFLVDSLAQLALIEQWFNSTSTNPHPGAFEVMLEIGVPGGRCGCRSEAEALALAQAVHASSAVRLVGIECYEGLAAKGQTSHDEPYAQALMERVHRIAREVDLQGWFETDEVLVSAGGSAIFDLVAGRLKPSLGKPVRGLLRSGCYVTHDHGQYRRMLQAVGERCGCDETLRPALEVWASVQSRPEPGLAILAAGRRDVSYDLELPIPFARAAMHERVPRAVPASWKVVGLNDQHAHLRWHADDEAMAPIVGERIGLGISHPCTTFDKWPWMPVVDDHYQVIDAIVTQF